jgi:hypothetical protein
VLLIAWGCSSSTAEKLRAAALAGSCSINSDCRDPYICAFERCHVPCTKDRDCDPGLRCVQGSTEGVPVCQLPDEVECETDRDCPGDHQVCGVDDECRDPCDTSADCTSTQICANSGECASTLSDHDHVDADGNIITGGSGTGGGSSGGGEGGEHSGGNAGTSAGNAGTSTGGKGGSGATTSGGGEGGEAGGNDTGGSGQGGGGGMSNGGAAGAGGNPGGSGGIAASGGNSGRGGAAGSAGTGGIAAEILTETPDGIETIDNNTRETALVTPLPSRATIYIVGTGGDEDWFSVTPPNDGHSHIISVVIAQESGLRTNIAGYTLVNNAPMDNFNFSPGSTGYAYATAGPGATILFRFVRGSGSIASGLAHLTFDVETENDANEPNNTKQTAKPISTGMTYSGIVLNPWVSDIDRPAQDWFQVDLAMGTTTLHLTGVPSQGRLSLSRVNPAGATTIMANTVEGAINDYSFTASEAGTYYFVIEPYAGIAGISSGAKPTYLTEPYSFSVTQP